MAWVATPVDAFRIYNFLTRAQGGMAWTAAGSVTGASFLLDTSLLSGTQEVRVESGGVTRDLPQPAKSLRFGAWDGSIGTMTATITINDAGQILLPDALQRAFGVEPGVRLRAEVNSGRMEIVKDVPEVTQGVLENGVLVLPRLGIKMDAAAAIRADRDERAERMQRQ